VWLIDAIQVVTSGTVGAMNIGEVASVVEEAVGTAGAANVVVAGIGVNESAVIGAGGDVVVNAVMNASAPTVVTRTGLLDVISMCMTAKFKCLFYEEKFSQARVSVWKMNEFHTCSD
jgi:hypothetical protein